MASVKSIRETAGASRPGRHGVGDDCRHFFEQLKTTSVFGLLVGEHLSPILTPISRQHGCIRHGVTDSLGCGGNASSRRIASFNIKTGFRL
jgi:hypothetical protein